MASLAGSEPPATNWNVNHLISSRRLDVNPDWSRFCLNGFCSVRSSFASGPCVSRRCSDFTLSSIAICILRLTNDWNGGEWGFLLGMSARARAEI